MQRKGLLLVGVMVALLATSTLAQNVTLPNAASPLASASQQVGITEIHIEYSRPSVRGRSIWGNLVQWDMINLGFGTAEKSPWRAGANENTKFTVSHDVQIEGKSLPAGTYGFFVAVQEDGSATLIFSQNSTSWGSYFYDPTEDVLRVDIQSEEISHVETLMYSFPEVSANYAVVALDWEKKRFPFKVSVDVPEVVIANGKNELRNTTGFNWQGPYSLAQYAMANNTHLEEAMGWAQTAAGMQPNFQTLSLLGTMQSMQGMDSESSETMEKAMEMGNALQIHQYGRQLIGQGKAEEALEAFEYNAKKHPDTWPVNYGLARGYSALGKYKKAASYLEKALENAPNEPNRQAIQANLEKLNNGEDIN
ncbi:MAG TPA: hypothetical protein DCE41_17720 [Cytophagales bacterium]|nr:hypothetical protein [Cytophagales bacterium]HAA23693.1 hypothetical protein [Cytophagales bacterium]HAP62869.1 hypothetical protein [Cytophagales bacterium]